MNNLIKINHTKIQVNQLDFSVLLSIHYYKVTARPIQHVQTR